MISDLPLRIELESRPGRHRHGTTAPSVRGDMVSQRTLRRFGFGP